MGDLAVAWTPASVRPAPPTVTASPQNSPMARTSSPCTDLP